MFFCRVGRNGSGKKPSKFAQKKNDERTTAEAGGRTTAWNAFFMNPDTVRCEIFWAIFLHFRLGSYTAGLLNVVDCVS